VQLAPMRPVPHYPAQSPARAWLARIPLGPCPSLHQLRRRSLRFVRRLPSYYGGVRLLVSVHHRLRLLTFPMRAGNGNAVPVRPETSQLPMRSLRAWCGLRPRQGDSTSHKRCRTCCLRANKNPRPLRYL